MRVTRIDFADEQPATIAMQLDIREALFLTMLLGRRPTSEMDTVMGGGGAMSSDIYRALAGMVFNTFWEDGVEGAKQELL